MIVRVFGDEKPWPGPYWEPTVYDGSFPQAGGAVGDLYINRYQDPPLIYIFSSRMNCEKVSAEEVQEWITGGLMKRPIRDQPTSPALPTSIPPLDDSEPLSGTSSMKRPMQQ